MKIGILGGSFNPPHELHLRQASSLLDKHILDKVIFVPNQVNPYHLKNLVDPHHRYKMVELMIQNHPQMEVSDIDLISDKQNYTYQTLDKLKSIYPNDDIMLIIGSDNLKEINHWGKYEYLLSTYKIIVTKRGDDDIELIFNEYPYLKQYKENIIPFNDFLTSSLSSTYIRDLLNKKENTKSLLTNEVYQYIQDNNLYSEE